MSDKRFTSYYERGNEVVIEDNGKRLSNKQLVDLLNELNDERMMYKTTIDKRIVELKEENEQLKKAREESDKFIVKKGLEIEFLEWCMK